MIVEEENDSLHFAFRLFVEDVKSTPMAYHSHSSGQVTTSSGSRFWFVFLVFLFFSISGKLNRFSVFSSSNLATFAPRLSTLRLSKKLVMSSIVLMPSSRDLLLGRVWVADFTARDRTFWASCENMIGKSGNGREKCQTF